MIISKEWLIESAACNDGIKWFTRNYKNDEVDVFDLIKVLCKRKKQWWAVWLIGRFLDDDVYMNWLCRIGNVTHPDFHTKLKSFVRHGIRLLEVQNDESRHSANNS